MNCNKVIRCLGVLATVGLLTACGTSAVSTNNRDLQNINVAQYFPSDHIQLIYDTYDDHGNIVATETQLALFIQAGANTQYLVDSTTTGQLAQGQVINGIVQNKIMKQSKYTVDSNAITLVGTNSSVLGSINHQEIILTKSPEWKIDESTVDKITAVNKEVSVRAGKFTNCIEVTQEAKSNEYSIYTRSYYAPKVGLVLQQIKGQNTSDYIPITELISYTANASNNTTNDSTNNNQPGNTDSTDPTDSTEPQIVSAAASGDMKLEESLLESGVSQNTQSDLKITPLIEASRNEHLDIVQLLLKSQADPNLTTVEGHGALYYAIVPKGQDSESEDIVKALLDAGANPNTQGEFGYTPLMQAVELDQYNLVKLLVEHHADVSIRSNSPDEGQKTALEIARDKGYTDIVQLLSQGN